MSISNDQLSLAKQWLEESDAVLLTSGAGLSAAAGIDYGSREWFTENFAPMLQYGVQTCGEILGGMGLPPLLQWGYLSHQLNLVRFDPKPSEIYQKKFAALSAKNHFVMTSNVDGLYERNGFDPNRVYTPQGDYANMQCIKPCSDSVWPTKTYIDAIRERTNSDTYELEDPSLIPKCPNCGGPLFMNVRAAHWFLDKPYEETAKRLESWLSEVKNSNLLIVEIGAGFNTPGVIRWPGERITRSFPNAKMIRVNPEHWELPENLSSCGLSIKSGASEFTDAWLG